MALSFPSNVLATALAAEPEKYGVERCEFDLLWRHEFSGLQSGDLVVKEFVPPRWKATVTSTIMEYKYWKKFKAKINSLSGSFRTFYLWDTISEYPEEDPDGSILGASTPTIQTLGGDLRSMRVTGLPPGYQLREGDALSFDWDTADARKAYHILTEDALANGAGLTPSFEVMPYIRTGANVGAAVTLVRANAIMRLVPGSTRILNDGSTTGRISFDAIQVV